MRACGGGEGGVEEMPIFFVRGVGAWGVGCRVLEERDGIHNERMTTERDERGGGGGGNGFVCHRPKAVVGVGVGSGCGGKGGGWEDGGRRLAAGSHRLGLGPSQVLVTDFAADKKQKRESEQKGGGVVVVVKGAKGGVNRTVEGKGGGGKQEGRMRQKKIVLPPPPAPSTPPFLTPSLHEASLTACLFALNPPGSQKSPSSHTHPHPPTPPHTPPVYRRRALAGVGGKSDHTFVAFAKKASKHTCVDIKERGGI